MGLKTEIMTEEPKLLTRERVISSEFLDEMSQRRKDAHKIHALREVIEALNESIKLLRPSTGIDLEELAALEQYLQTVPLTKRAGFLDSAMVSEKFASEEAQRKISEMSFTLLPLSKRGAAQFSALTKRIRVGTPVRLLGQRDAALTRLRAEKEQAEQELASVEEILRMIENTRARLDAIFPTGAQGPDRKTPTARDFGGWGKDVPVFGMEGTDFQFEIKPEPRPLRRVVIIPDAGVKFNELGMVDPAADDGDNGDGEVK